MWVLALFGMDKLFMTTGVTLGRMWTAAIPHRRLPHAGTAQERLTRTCAAGTNSERGFLSRLERKRFRMEEYCCSDTPQV